jgi:CHAD domain-containing protein
MPKIVHSGVLKQRLRPLSKRAQRALERAASDRVAQVGAVALVAAGAVAAGKAALGRVRDREDGGGRSRAYTLKTKERPAKGVRRIADGRCADALEQLRSEDVDRAEGIHEARKDLKKLRSLLRLVRDQIGDEAYRRENERYRDAGRLLSAARDAEVRLGSLNALRERFEEELDGDGVGAYASVLDEERRAAAEGDPDQERATERAITHIVLGRAAIEEWSFPSHPWSPTDGGLARTYKRGRRALDAARTGEAEQVHEWRKRSKDLWYHLRLLRETWPEVLGPTADEAHELSDLLGDHHDLTVLGKDVRERSEVFEDRDERRDLLDVIDRRQRELLDAALPLGERLYAEKPKAFARRLRGYWRGPKAS